jgi:hypothetical protein
MGLDLPGLMPSFANLAPPQTFTSPPAYFETGLSSWMFYRQ